MNNAIDDASAKCSMEAGKPFIRTYDGVSLAICYRVPSQAAGLLRPLPRELRSVSLSFIVHWCLLVSNAYYITSGCFKNSDLYFTSCISDGQTTAAYSVDE